MPIIKTVVQAGWKPVNYATSSSTSTLIERFGNASSGTFYVTAQNSGASITAVTLTLDGAGLGIPSTTPVTVTEMLSNTGRAVTRTGTDIKISETLDPGETVAYKVTLAVGGGDAPVANFTFSPSNPLARAVRPVHRHVDEHPHRLVLGIRRRGNLHGQESRLTPSPRPARTRSSSPRPTPAAATSAKKP